MGEKLLLDRRVDFQFDDERGSLTQLVHEGFAQINVLVTRKGVTRGGHYHKARTEAFYVVLGSVKVRAWEGTRHEERVFKEGAFFEVPPMVAHSMTFDEDCTMVQMYDRCVENPDGSKDIWPSAEDAG